MDITGLEEPVRSIMTTALTNNNTQCYSPDVINRTIKLFYMWLTVKIEGGLVVRIAYMLKIK